MHATRVYGVLICYVRLLDPTSHHNVFLLATEATPPPPPHKKRQTKINE